MSTVSMAEKYLKSFKSADAIRRACAGLKMKAECCHANKCAISELLTAKFPEGRWCTTYGKISDYNSFMSFNFSQRSPIWKFLTKFDHREYPSITCS